MKNVVRSIEMDEKTMPCVVLFGGDTDRKDELAHLLSSAGNVTLYGFTNETDGIEKIKELGIQTDLIFIDGNYTDEERMRIKNLATYLHPDVELSEPGHKYPYSDLEIIDDVWTKLEKRLKVTVN